MYDNIPKGWLTLWTPEKKETFWFDVSDLKSAVDTAMYLSESRDVYFGLGTRKEQLPGKQRGRSVDIASIPFIWVEIDIKGGEHAAKNLPTVKEAEKILNTFPLKPSAVIHSGGGWHCYWQFDAAINITSKEDMSKVSELLQNFQDGFIKLASSQGLHIDKTSDLARVLRVPGTFNRKSEPKMVEIIKTNTKRYSIEEIRVAIEKFHTAQGGLDNLSEQDRFDAIPVNLPDAKVYPIISGCQFIQHYLNNKENATYSEWLAALSIGAYCEDHENLCHSWSMGHPNYSVSETEIKLHEIRANLKPRTCESIDSEFGGCSNCFYYGKINSPIALGMRKSMIMHPFLVKRNALFKKILKTKRGNEVEEVILVSRMVPTITKELSNVEKNSIYYELSWMDRGRERREVVTAGTVATKREILLLADKGFHVNDLNYKDLIQYFDSYLTNNQLEQAKMVERLGHIKGKFIHPLDLKGIKVVPNDIGERQLLEAFEAKGDLDSWKLEVFDRIKEHPKVLFLLLASFASVILHDLKVSPFLIDLSGSTSQGKTTALQVARSVWGNKFMVNEWNATKVSIERKAGFLNSFPLFMDDTRKADERVLKAVVYQFSGGRAKGRGSLRGSQTETTWQNILFSTGEASLSEYAAKHGAAARIISIEDQPFRRTTPAFFSDLYNALDQNYGSVGLEFLNGWSRHKEELLQEFNGTKEMYAENAMGDEVLLRLSLYHAAIHFAGIAVNQILGLEVDLKIIYGIFSEISEVNKTIDKPKQLLEEILIHLDSSRRDVYYRYPPNEMKAIYKYDTLCLTPAFLKEYLSIDEKVIRGEWLRRGYTQKCENDGNIVDYKVINHVGSSFRVVVVNKEFIKNMGLDFKEDIFP
ncbi:DUF927 domain-containing protein [Bacillus benzoevorans]